MKRLAILVSTFMIMAMAGNFPAMALDNESVGAVTIFSTYLKFKGVAADRYTGKILTISGQVRNTHRRGKKVIIDLGDDGPYKGVLVEIEGDNQKETGFTKLKVGQKTKIKAICERIYGPVVAKGLYVVSPK